MYVVDGVEKNNLRTRKVRESNGRERFGVTVRSDDIRHLAPGGGRSWWAHFEFTRINTTPTVLPKKIED
jgi:hypothetical protein